MDAELLSAATSLDMSPITTNEAVSYRNMQINTEVPLVRFQSSSTNISFLAIADASEAYAETRLYLCADGQTKAVGPDRAPDDRVIAVTDGCTNLIGIVRHFNGKNSIVILPENQRSWKDITPRDFRNQTGLLATGTKAVAEEKTVSKSILEKLEETAWATDYFKQEAEQILKNIKQGGRP